MAINSARQAGELVEIMTNDRGAVLVTSPDDQELLAAWLAAGGVIDNEA